MAAPPRDAPSRRVAAPHVPAERVLPELTAKALILGIGMAVILGFANAYLGLKAGLTVSATFPAAVVAIAVFRLPGLKGSILEQNITRTAASAGEALVAGAIFTIPAFLIARVDQRPVWEHFNYWPSTGIMLLGGILGVLLIILLRRTLVEDPALPFPESAACAEMVKAGQEGQSGARDVFGAMGVAAVLELFKNGRGLPIIRESVERFLPFTRSTVTHGSADAPHGLAQHGGGVLLASPLASPALAAVGYIIGPRLAAVTFSGGVLGWLFLVPLLLFADPDLASRARIGDATDLAISVWRNEVRPIAVGTMLVGAVHTLLGLRGSLASAGGRIVADLRARLSRGSAPLPTPSRLESDLAPAWIAAGVVATTVPLTALYWYFTASLPAALLAAVAMGVTAMLFSAVGGYLVGLIGGSNQPISGLALSTLILSALLMVAAGATGAGGVAAVLGVAAVVCCASSMAGEMIQDLKVGQILGGTPWRMEVALIVATAIVSFTLTWPMIILHHGVEGGIGGPSLPAPQAGLMAQLATGIVGGQMPWGLILIGIALGVGLVLIRSPSPMLIAVGMYLHLATTSAIFVGGALAWIAEAVRRRRGLSAEARSVSENRGILMASGLIGGEALMAVFLASLYLVLPASPPEGMTSVSVATAWLGWNTDLLQASHGGWLAAALFGVLAWLLVVLPLRARR